MMWEQECCSRKWITSHYIDEHKMYVLHAKVLRGLEAGGYWPTELTGPLPPVRAPARQSNHVLVTALAFCVTLLVFALLWLVLDRVGLVSARRRVVSTTPARL